MYVWNAHCRVLASLLILGLPACGGSLGAWSRVAPQHALTADAPMATTTVTAPLARPERGGGFSLGATDSMSSLSGSGDTTPGSEEGGGVSAPERPRYAQAETGAGDEEVQATDVREEPLLIYTAEIRLAVHQVADKQERVERIAREAGGHLDRRTDDEIRIRVPAAQFRPVLEAVLELGDVLRRDVRVQDVSEEFHDIRIRIRTLQAMYTRVERLLADADDVGEALAVQQHLERITIELERMRGRLRFLSDRIAFSTITVRFRELARVSEPTFVLPFRWLRSLGLQSLLRLR